MVKPGAVVIDVGVNRLDSGASPATWTSSRRRAWRRAITPVPGGVGPMTVAMLLRNTLLIAERFAGRG